MDKENPQQNEQDSGNKQEVITMTPAQLAERLERAKAPFADYERIKAERDQLKADVDSKEKTAAERIKSMEDQLANLNQTLATERLEALRVKVAGEKGVPVHQAVGDTREEMEKAADRFLADAKAVLARTKPGVVPTQGTGSPDPDSSYEAGRARAEARFNKRSTRKE